MKQEFKWLSTLQSIDNEIQDIRLGKEEIPKQIERLRKKMDDCSRALEQAGHHLTELKKEYKLSEIDLKETEEKIKHYSVQLYSAKTNEQYKAFLNEIDAQKKTKSKVEDRMIEILGAIEQTEVELDKKKKEIVELEKTTEKEIEKLEKKLQLLKKEEEQKAQEREKLVGDLGTELVRVYERIRTGKGGIAVAMIEDGRCSGCLHPLPPQLVLEVEKKDQLFFCEYCGRILVSEKN